MRPSNEEKIIMFEIQMKQLVSFGTALHGRDLSNDMLTFMTCDISSNSNKSGVEYSEVENPKKVHYNYIKPNPILFKKDEMLTKSKSFNQDLSKISKNRFSFLIKDIKKDYIQENDCNRQFQYELENIIGLPKVIKNGKPLKILSLRAQQ